MSTSITSADTVTTLYVAIELSKAGWLVAMQTPLDGRPRRYKLKAGDIAGLLALIERWRERVIGADGGKPAVFCCYEAGYDGFWVQRRLAAQGISCHVMDPASLQVDRRARRVKTDAIDVEALLRTLIAWSRGEIQVCRMVRVPTVAEEDARRLHRERKRLVGERIAHVNRMKSLLALHGVSDYQPLRSDRHARLEQLVGADGCALPPQIQRELERELARLELVMAQIAEVEAARDAVVTTTARPEDEKSRLMIANLTRLRGIGPEIATVLVREIFYRCFGNRRQVASYAGLTPSPYASGGTSRDQGISKAGNALVRTTMIELAWLWLRYQPDSALSRWFRERAGKMAGRIRRIMIVAVARKLLVALWRYVNGGVVPTDAVIRRACQREPVAA